MPWYRHIKNLIGNPVGISFKDGRGTSGILWEVHDNTIYLMEYLYQKQFATKHYDFDMIDGVYPFPRHQIPTPIVY